MGGREGHTEINDFPKKNKRELNVYRGTKERLRGERKKEEKKSERTEARGFSIKPFFL